MKTILIDPPKLSSWMPCREKMQTLVLFDLEIDTIEDLGYRFDLIVAFNHVAVRRGIVQEADYYVGATGAEILAEFKSGLIRKFTGEHSIDVNYKSAVNRNRKSAVTLEPGIRKKSSDTELGITLGALSWDEGTERSFVSSFKSRERILSPIHSGNLIRWVLSLPRGEKAVRDYLLGNLYLFVECSWGRKSPKGKISARPSDVRFFDSERRPLSKKKSLAMLFCLWKKRIKIFNKDGIYVTFSVNR